LAERIPARDALDWGLVSAVFPAESFDAEVDKVVATLVSGPAVAFRHTKDAINAATLTELDAALEREKAGQSVLITSGDFEEGARAFQQRRSPTFTDS
jgi:enoyl-CoA hydratase